MTTYKLCYIEGNWAWFTTKDLDTQWGDDWNDAPYEHNAGDPYGPCQHKKSGKCICDSCKRDYNKDGSPKWRIMKVAFEVDLIPPKDVSSACEHVNSPYSVEMINNGAVPWLRPDKFTKTTVIIPAGTELNVFIDLIDAAGGTVYTEVINEDNTST